MKMIMYSNFTGNNQMRSSGGGWFSKLVLLFVLVPIIELWILIEVGKILGGLETVLLVVVTGILGIFLMKAEGARVWLQFQQDLLQRKIPQDGILDGLLILLGGVLLMVPGILTDVLGLLCIIPLTRHVFREFLFKRIKHRFK